MLKERGREVFLILWCGPKSQDRTSLQHAHVPLAHVARLHEWIVAVSLHAFLLEHAHAAKDWHVLTASALSTVWSSAADTLLAGFKPVPLHAHFLGLLVQHVGQIGALKTPANFASRVVGERIKRRHVRQGFLLVLLLLPPLLHV